MTYKIESRAESAPRLLEWIANRGGIAKTCAAPATTH